VPSSDPSLNRPGGFPSRAACYREWQVNRSVYVAAVLTLLAPWALWAMTVVNLFDQPQLIGPGATLHSLMEPLLLFSFPLVIDLVGVAALGLVLFGYDRAVGGLRYALQGPLRRRDVWMAKALFGTVMICSVMAAGTVAMLIAAKASGNGALSGRILAHALLETGAQLELFMTALAMSGAMAPIFAGLATATWAILPAALSGLVQTVLVEAVAAPLSPTPAYVPIAPWVASLSHFLTNCSPFQSAPLFWPAQDTLWLGAAFFAWAALLIGAAPRWWARAPFERLQEGFFYPALWNVYYAFLAAVSALVVVTLITRGSVQGLSWAALYGALAVAGWFFWRAVVMWRIGPRQAGHVGAVGR
jgi:hypothetical protein